MTAALKLYQSSEMIPKRRQDKFGKRHMDVIRVLKDHPNGLTDVELAAVLNLGETNARIRRIEMVRQGNVQNSGQKRKTKSGWAATVWVLTKAGKLKTLETKE